MNGGRKLSAWNIFVKKIYHEGKSKNKNYEFKQALADASRRKGEMGHGHHHKTGKKSKGHRRSSRSMAGGRRTRRRHH